MMNPIDHAFRILKQGETDPDERMSWCEECGNRISGAEIGGFSDAGPYCKECDYWKNRATFSEKLRRGA